MNQNDLEKIKAEVEVFLRNMTIDNFEVVASVGQNNSVGVKIQLNEPQFLIGQNGQTLLEFGRVLKIILNRKLAKVFYLDLDINNYKKKKNEYLQYMERDLADEVAATKEKKIMAPMSSYERRIIHAELSGRQDIITESQGDGVERCVVISPVN